MFDPIFINQIARCPITGEVIGMEYSFRQMTWQHASPE